MKLLKNVPLYKVVKDYMQYWTLYGNGFGRTWRHPLAYKVGGVKLTANYAIKALSAYLKVNV